jgi:hypothetical protein
LRGGLHPVEGTCRPGIEIEQHLICDSATRAG